MPGVHRATKMARSESRCAHEPDATGDCTVQPDIVRIHRDAGRSRRQTAIQDVGNAEPNGYVDHRIDAAAVGTNQVDPGHGLERPRSQQVGVAADEGPDRARPVSPEACPGYESV